MAFSIGNIRPGMALVIDNQLFLVVSNEHAKLGRGSAFCRTKLKNLKTGQTVERTLRDSDNITEAFLEERKLQFLYSQQGHYHFMDLETYEEYIVDKEKIEEKIELLTENIQLSGSFYNGELINLILPTAVELKVIETEPGFKGDTVKAGTKPAKLETGLVIQVPLFINNGDVIKVDTRTKNYLERA